MSSTILLAAAVLLVTILAGCGGSPQSNLPRDSSGRYIIHMTEQDQFVPADAYVPAGATVVWVNDAAKPSPTFDCLKAPNKTPLCHDVDIWLGDDQHIQSSFNNSRRTAFIGPGESFAWVTGAKGTYNVFCHVHHDPERMISTLRVV